MQITYVLVPVNQKTWNKEREHSHILFQELVPTRWSDCPLKQVTHMYRNEKEYSSWTNLFRHLVANKSFLNKITS